MYIQWIPHITTSSEIAHDVYKSEIITFIVRQDKKYYPD